MWNFNQRPSYNLLFNLSILCFQWCFMSSRSPRSSCISYQLPSLRHLPREFVQPHTVSGSTLRSSVPSSVGASTRRHLASAYFHSRLSLWNQALTKLLNYMKTSSCFTECRKQNPGPLVWYSKVSWLPPLILLSFPTLGSSLTAIRAVPCLFSFQTLSKAAITPRPTC